MPVFTVFTICILQLMWPVLPVSLDCPFLIPISVFANVYLTTRFVGVGTNSVFCPLYQFIFSLSLS
jgi:hypothetical protein